MSSTSTERFQYKVGGSLDKNAPCYVVRQSDEEFYAALKAGEFCYVLNSRQMGKSSLRVRVMQQLQADNIACAVIDITSIGSQGITAAEWYLGVVHRLVRNFRIKVDALDWWNKREGLSSVQRLSEFFEEVLLVEISQPIVIFIDEIDSIIKLNFKDDFFALIRACYNQRAESSEYQRLTFSLLGVATPSDLIQDKERTPFNIGCSIQLDGFKLREALPLAKGLSTRSSNPELVLREILSWTGGQPFLTQKLCQIILDCKTQIPEKQEAQFIENLVKIRVVKNWENQDEPEHLRTIRDRILRSDRSLFKILGLYDQILRKGELLADDSLEQMELRLSGLAVIYGNQLRIHNRIYALVFNQHWIRQTLLNLQPYAPSLSAWLASNCRDTSYLLQGKNLKEALSWAASRVLSVREYQFILASQEAYIQKKYSSVSGNIQKISGSHTQIIDEPSTLPLTTNISVWKLMKSGEIKLESALERLVNQQGVVHQELLDSELDNRFFSCFPKEYRLPPIVPLLFWQNCYYLGCPVEISSVLVEDLRKITRSEIKIISITEKSYSDFLKRLGIDIGDTKTGKYSDINEYKNVLEQKVFFAKNDNQIKRLEFIITNALRQRASDIHLEPTEAGLRIRYRIDGLLRDVFKPEVGIDPKLLSALKAQAGMDTIDNRLPQDGRLRLKYAVNEENIDLDIRISTLPSVRGEKAVIRLLPSRNPFQTISDLGFTQSALTIYRSWLQEPQGMIIICGPTSSGKTSTLYTSLQLTIKEDVNVVTLEDPVEYLLPGIIQSQINQSIGMTFSVGLKAVLRQDPNIIMLGEIRDEETAEIAVRAGLTGHLLLTTLHTNDSISAIFRLNGMKIDPNLISDALLGIVAQRLVRKICSHCSEPYKPAEEDWRYLGLEEEKIHSETWRQGKGCAQCSYTGYLGREAIIELLNVDAIVKKFIRAGDTIQMYDYLSKNNFDSFRLAAIDKVMQGITTVTELRRVLPYRLLHPQVSDWIDRKII